ncbi:MAG: DUF1294 domain-containing protein [Bacteroidales bacterium]|jgi:uncharacterized membrane protein YsdA (DUF1294 family)|nr:DUF1294 domain-containing protein [Bacteroidales bacterium]
MIKYFVFYLVIINVLSAIIFYEDLRRARKKKHRRIKETTLHILEIIGGVIGVLLIMLGEGHKSNKKSYFIWTYIIFFLWLIVGYILIIGIF